LRRETAFTDRPITPDALELLDMVVKTPGLSRKQLRHRTGRNIQAVTKQLATLIQSDYIYYLNRANGSPRKYFPAEKALKRLRPFDQKLNAGKRTENH